MKPRKRNLYIGAMFMTVLAALAIAQIGLGKVAGAQGKGATQAPMFQVDPMWPKPLPNHWILGEVIGVAVDARDHIWLVHRQGSISPSQLGATLSPPISECCVAAPPVLEFDQAGNLVGHWGGPGPGYEWGIAQHGIFVDYKNNVWVGMAGAAVIDPKRYKDDAQVLKFTRDGKFLLQIGKAGMGSEGSNSTKYLGQPTDIFVDQATNQVFISDGYTNRRVIAFDADTGEYKRHWGAYGNKPEDGPRKYDPSAPPSQQFGNAVHCVDISKDDLVYVCDRMNNRIQVFKREGTFVKEGFLAKNTGRSGSTWDLAFSGDAQQRFVYVADGSNEKVHVLLRDSLALLRSFGDGGRYPGQFFGVHNVAADSKGNLYTGETFQGRRLQRFLFKGTGAAGTQNQ